MNRNKESSSVSRKPSSLLLSFSALSDSSLLSWTAYDAEEDKEVFWRGDFYAVAFNCSSSSSMNSRHIWMTIWASNNMFITVTRLQMTASRLTIKLPSMKRKVYSSSMISIIGASISTGPLLLLMLLSVPMSSTSSISSESGKEYFKLRKRKLVVRKSEIIDLRNRASSEAQTNFFDAF